ncbi:MAG: hypothetical protein U9P10_09315 [Thermodesulfobacteriota bacterium]|nr:hypothetical protein [Thermodesulfobacteriota bacterium]
MIKIAHVIYSFGIGGLEKGITTLINHGSDDIKHVIISLCGKKDSETLLLGSARIICLDKLNEGISNTILEAMASSLPNVIQNYFFLTYHLVIILNSELLTSANFECIIIFYI